MHDKPHEWLVWSLHDEDDKLKPSPLLRGLEPMGFDEFDFSFRPSL